MTDDIFPDAKPMATMAAWGVPVHDPDARMWPCLSDFVLRVDDELEVFEAERRARLDSLAKITTKPCPRDAAFMKGAFWEALVVAAAERPGVSQ